MNDKVKIWIDEALAGGDETVSATLKMENGNIEWVPLSYDRAMSRINRKGQPDNVVTQPIIPKQHCYKCDGETTWLAPDGRCGDCTGYTPEEIRGEV